jgi:hypothetical protein
MYGYGRLNTVERRQEYRKFVLAGCDIKEYPELDCVIGISRTGLICARAFVGTAARPTWYYRFRSCEEMNTYIEKFLNERKKLLEYKQDRKNKRKVPAISTVPFKIGDILYDSWGWEQTNIDFYEVIKVKTASSIVIRKIAQNTVETSFMSGHTTPKKGKYVDEPITKRVQWYDNKPYIASEFGSIGKWDGKPISCSWYA